MTVPQGLREECAALYRRALADVPEGMELDACEREAVRRAAKLADLAWDLEADLAQRGLWVVGSTGQDMLNPEVGRLATLHASIASTLARVKLTPPVKTGHLNRRQRSQLADARRARWPVANA